VRFVGKRWRKNRPDAATLFDDELDDVIENLRDGKSIGAVYRTLRGEVVRRVLLPKSVQHVYFAVDEANGEVVIYTVWGARRRRGPKL
jgi:plasmid stabilization system protein ParE